DWVRRLGVLPRFFFFQAEDGIRDRTVTGVQTCALPIYSRRGGRVGVRLRGAGVGGADDDEGVDGRGSSDADRGGGRLAHRRGLREVPDIERARVSGRGVVPRGRDGRGDGRRQAGRDDDADGGRAVSGSLDARARARRITG